MIKDFDLTKLPSLPHTHRDHTRREETRIKYQSQNEANNEKRNLITYEYWTLPGSVGTKFHTNR